MDELVTMEDVIASRLIPDLDPLNLRYLGKNWFKDAETGVVYHFYHTTPTEVAVKETRQSIRKAPKPKRSYMTDKPKFTTIKCVDCGAERDIKVQDAFQVKRCKVCQNKLKNKRRSEMRRAQKQRERQSDTERDNSDN